MVELALDSPGRAAQGGRGSFPGGSSASSTTCALLHGHRHRIYRSAPLKALAPLYLGTGNWPDKPPAGVDNGIVLVQPTDQGQDAQDPPKPE